MSATTNLNSFLALIDAKIANCDPTNYKEFLHLVELRAHAYNALGLNGGTISGGTFEVGLTQEQAAGAIDDSLDIEAIKTSLSSINSSLTSLQGYVDAVETKLDNVDGSVNNVGSLLTSSNTKLDTANTRLNTINTNIDGLEGFTDGIETLLSAVGTKLDTLVSNLDGVEGSIDGLESLISATNTLLVSTNGYVDSLEILIGTSNTNTNTISNSVTNLLGYVDGLETLLGTVNTKLDTLITNSALLYPTATTYRSLAAGATGVVKASPGRVYSLSCTNMSTQARWFMLFNKTTTPSVDEVPLCSYPVYGNNGFLVLDSDYFVKQGTTFSNGIVWGLSTAPTEYKAGDGTLVITEVTYI